MAVDLRGVEDVGGVADEDIVGAGELAVALARLVRDDGQGAERVGPIVAIGVQILALEVQRDRVRARRHHDAAGLTGGDGVAVVVVQVGGDGEGQGLRHVEPDVHRKRVVLGVAVGILDLLAVGAGGHDDRLLEVGVGVGLGDGVGVEPVVRQIALGVLNRQVYQGVGAGEGLLVDARSLEGQGRHLAAGIEGLSVAGEAVLAAAIAQEAEHLVGAGGGDVQPNADDQAVPAGIAVGVIGGVAVGVGELGPAGQHRHRRGGAHERPSGGVVAVVAEDLLNLGVGAARIAGLVIVVEPLHRGGGVVFQRGDHRVAGQVPVDAAQLPEPAIVGVGVGVAGDIGHADGRVVVCRPAAQRGGIVGPVLVDGIVRGLPGVGDAVGVFVGVDAAVVGVRLPHVDGVAGLIGGLAGVVVVHKLEGHIRRTERGRAEVLEVFEGLNQRGVGSTTLLPGEFDVLARIILIPFDGPGRRVLVIRLLATGVPLRVVVELGLDLIGSVLG